jgi:cyclic beta-1,2-glucan synthetase
MSLATAGASTAHEVHPSSLGTATVSRGPIRSELLGPERLESRARQIARASTRVAFSEDRLLLERFERDSKSLYASHRIIAQAYVKHESLPGEAAWFYDNFHIVNETLREIRTDLPHGYYRRLPKLQDGVFAGLPRVYWLALELVAHTDSALEEASLAKFIQAYQDVTPLTIGELWAVPIMLRLVLVENLCRLADGTVEVRNLRILAKSWVDRLRDPSGDPDQIAEDLVVNAGHLVVSVLQGLRTDGVTRERLERFEEAARERGVHVEDLLLTERQRQAANQVTVGNGVTSLRLLSAIEWPVFYEKASLVDAKLRRDPAGVYSRQDFATRDRYRQAIEVLARDANRNELEICDHLLERAQAAQPKGEFLATDAPAECHIGHYLIGAGRPAFAQDIGAYKKIRDWSVLGPAPRASAWYFGSIAILTALIVGAAAWYGATHGASAAMIALIVAAAAMPAADIAIGLVNYLVTKIVPPQTLPKMDFSRGIAEDCATFVVMPTLLTNPENNATLLERIEIHYLSNPDPQLRFALLTDWTDAAEEHTPNDQALVQQILDGVTALNRRHAPQGPPRFFLFHRRRLWNPIQNCWMGWERKRGKLHEFNRLLLGKTDTTYSQFSCPPNEIPKARFVITLDADTQIPRETASRLIGTLAHPLNRPRFDPAQRRVVSGYAVLQPRVSVSMPAARRSRFSRMLAGSAGIDPYTTATSDVYQDLFSSGTFTGKGIYDVQAFEAATGPAFPENHILSHDLIEGNFARCALVSDIEVIDDLPARYNAFAKREHRWVRGDWQLLPWLGRSIPAYPPDAEPGSRQISFVPNVLPLVERWKVFDNLRRSLMPIALLIFFVLGWTVLPGSPWVWTLFGLTVPFLPVLLMLASAFRHRLRGSSFAIQSRELGLSLISTAGQAVTVTSFLVHQALTLADAIGRTLWRLVITHRNTLEWESAAATERRLGSSLVDFTRFMIISPLIALAVAGLIVLVRPSSLLAATPILALWFFAPLLAFRLSQPIRLVDRQITDEERNSLRRMARKTWEFFELFVTPADHGLPPDNFQEEPKGELARRTSPTNIGLSLAANVAAHDFGYISWPRMLERLQLALTSIDKLERHRGHLLNWYRTDNLSALEPRYVSTVDSGNFLASLIAVRHGLQERLQVPFVGPEWREGILDTWRLADFALRYGAFADRIPSTDLLKGLGQIAAVLQELPADLASWHDWLLRLDDLAGHLDATVIPPPLPTRRWVERLVDQIRERRRELTEIAPWIESLRLVRDNSEYHPSDSAAAETLKSILARWSAAQSVTQIVEQALPDSLALQALLPQLPSDKARSRLNAVMDDLKKSKANEVADRCRQVIEHLHRIELGMDFSILYNETRHLFTIGFNLSMGRLDNSYYDLLASEASLTSYLAIARGEAHRRHWFQLGRPVTRVGESLALVSWGGTMFEYLMPKLFLKSYQQTLLDETRRAVVKRQIEYGRERGVPWGISESGYSLTDVQQNYQYQSFGVPGLGLKRGLEQDLVIAPYASVMAVIVDPHAAAENFNAIANIGGEGPWGFYEAVDFTPERVPSGRKNVVIRSYMAHHQGMSFLALANRLLGEPVVRRFHSEPMVRATELLLQEKVPWEAPVLALVDSALAASASPREGAVPISRSIDSPESTVPRTHLISNSEYSVLVTNAGTGRSLYRHLDVTRWREDATLDNWGQFVYVRDLTADLYWSAGHAPVCRQPDSYSALFAIDKAEFHRRDGEMETHWEITVSTENPAEVRRLTLTNHDDISHTVELTSYVELALAPHAADLAHPAYGKLFLETEYLPAVRALLCHRRPRTDRDPHIWAMHVAAADVPFDDESQFETSRSEFLGRGRTYAEPRALDPGVRLSKKIGAVIDPIFSLRRRVTVPPGGSVTVSYSTAVTNTRDEAEALADRYHYPQAVVRAFELAWAHAPVELQHLGLSAAEAHLMQRLAGHIFFPNPTMRAPASVLKANKLAQDGLWKYGISGDAPIVLVTLASNDDVALVRQLLQAHSYWRYNGLSTDLVILDEQAASYLDDFNRSLQQLIRSSPARDVLDRTGGVFLRRGAEISEDDLNLLMTVARAIFRGQDGPLEKQIERMLPEPELPTEFHPAVAGNGLATPVGSTKLDPLSGMQLENGFGGFSKDGREYVLTVPGDLESDHLPPAPWINCLGNSVAGCIVTDSGLGPTWTGNSQVNRLTPWSNDPVLDPPAEIVYLRDESTGEVWTPTPRPLGQGVENRVRHGQGYTIYEQVRQNIASEMRVFVPIDDPVKIIDLKLTNRGKKSCRLSVWYYAEWVLGGPREKTAMFIVPEIDSTSGAIFARNSYRFDFPNQVAFADVLQRPRSVTADRLEFFGRNRSHQRPAALERTGLSNRADAGMDACAAFQVEVALEAGESKTVTFLLGETTDTVAARTLLQKYRAPGRVDDAFDDVCKYWDQLLTAIQVRTPDPALNVMINRWLLYQVLGCRMWGRTAFYQSGGAFGFRDQIQDSLAMVYAAPHLCREQLLRAAARQFLEGDVQHWWHPPGGGGTRTRCSDDRLWLPFATLRYVAATGDTEILDVQVPFLQAPLLKHDQEEEYVRPEVSEQTGTLFEHCARAIDVSLDVGVHGLPLIGTCDWNDGFSKVGAEGKGESTWLAWFILEFIDEFAALADQRGEGERAKTYRLHAEKLRASVEQNAWDGEWYIRAFFDDGTPLGSHTSVECQIDSLAQTWAVISGRGDPQRTERAMQAVWSRLVRPEHRITLLFDPPFDKAKPNPGYIAGYIRGVRENGGQYTHAATWVIKATAMLGHGDHAMELVDLVNPVRASANEEEAIRYAVEPYVIAADVYNTPGYEGRGGWTWYTGSASWFYRVVVEDILGLSIRDGKLTVNPCIPTAWKQFDVTFRFKTSSYEIHVENTGVERGVTSVLVDGKAVSGHAISLRDDGRMHRVEVRMGRTRTLPTSGAPG